MPNKTHGVYLSIDESLYRDFAVACVHQGVTQKKVLADAIRQFTKENYPNAKAGPKKRSR